MRKPSRTVKTTYQKTVSKRSCLLKAALLPLHVWGTQNQ